MKLSKEREKENKARNLIIKALDAFNGPDPNTPAFSEERISADEMHEKLTGAGIDMGVSALVLINNMAGGSRGDVDLYQLLHRYLFNLDDRKEINGIIKKL